MSALERIDQFVKDNVRCGTCVNAVRIDLFDVECLLGYGVFPTANPEAFCEEHEFIDKSKELILTLMQDSLYREWLDDLKTSDPELYQEMRKR